MQVCRYQPAKSGTLSFILGLAAGIILGLLAFVNIGCEALQVVDENAEAAREVVNDPALGVSNEVREPVGAVADAVTPEGDLDPVAVSGIITLLGGGAGAAALGAIGAGLFNRWKKGGQGK